MTDMQATVMHGAGDVRIETVPDARIVQPTDALVTITHACICGSDLWPYQQMKRDEPPRRMGHEFIGLVEEVGADVRTVRRGDLVVAPFAWSDGTCDFCRDGLQTSCRHGGFWGGTKQDGGQGEAVRVPLADGTLVRLPVGRDDALLPSLLTLSDVMGTGHHAARAARVSAGKTVAVVGDGAVGLCGVIAARRLGAERIILLGRYPDRIALAWQFGATDIVSERGDEAIERVRELTGGDGAHSVLECVGHGESMRTALLIARAGGTVGRVGLPQDGTVPAAVETFFRNVTIAGGPAPARAYIEELMPDIMEGRIQPGRVLDLVMTLGGVPEGYRAMNERKAIKVLIEMQ
jgi:threonine dehydrogenase-like Zn-dependent dehydrogenase